MQPGSYGYPSAAPGGPVPAQPQPAQRIRPSGWWFAVAGAVALAGIALGIALIVRAALDYNDRVDDFVREDIPATLEVEIVDTGGYSIYHEYVGADANRFVVEPDVTVTDPAGEELRLEAYSGSVTYSIGGHEGVGVYTFEADQPGTYQVLATGEPGTGIAVGRGLGRGLVGGIVGGLALAFVGVVAGGVLAIVVGVQRGRNRRAMAPPPPPFAGWGAPPPGWPGAPPGWPQAPGAPGAYGPGGYGPGGYGPGGYGPGGYGPGGYGPGPDPSGPPAPASPSLSPPVPSGPPAPAPAGWPPSDAPSPQDAPPTSPDAPPPGGTGESSS